MSRTSDRIWSVIAFGTVVGVPLYNIWLADEGDTLSEAFDRYMQRWPWLGPAVLTLARHVANDISPAWADPISLGFVAARSIVRRQRRPVLVAV